MANKRKRWLYSEEEKLKELMKTHSTADLQKIFLDRSKKSIERKIEELRQKGKMGYRSSVTRGKAIIDGKRNLD